MAINSTDSFLSSAVELAKWAKPQRLRLASTLLGDKILTIKDLYPDFGKEDFVFPSASSKEHIEDAAFAIAYTQAVHVSFKHDKYLDFWQEEVENCVI